MAPFLLFVFMFASQLITGFNEKLPPPLYGDAIHVLSIDGGGIKGIIPAQVLDYLEKALKAKNETSSLADYFDVIAGSSTGGLMTAMLTSPHPNYPSSPLFTPAEIVQFYMNNGSEIFKNRTWNWYSKYPRYDGVFLHNITRELLKETRLNQTLTNVVIPTFDLKKLKPVIFSSYKLKTLPRLNAKLSDICIGTSAAPSYLPPYYFENDHTEFNLIDGGAAAANPTRTAIGEVIQHHNFTKIRVLSLGTGIQKVVEKYDAKNASTWQSFSLNSKHVTWSSVSSEILSRASSDMDDYYLATMFPGLQLEDNSLRIQEYNLDKSMDSLDNVTKENLDNLQNAGNQLLQEIVMKRNVDTFDLEETDQTYAKALDSWAEILYEERQLRLKRKSMEKGG
ncbi:patatin-like protein 4 [Gastrolobium bilobum]|uniref:patatin-like protein 4 n=1 Tax=Gastrolobium bilobum TaxID=150636 RepID=UPI002AB0E3ED|nr:patatin-like protein 4 [Gastrolobium bilobum]